MDYVSLATSVGVAGTLMAAALAKLASPERLTALVRDALRLAPAPAALVARAIAGAEIAVGVTLATPPAARIGGYGAVVF
jgi:hypothetical protein